MARKIKARDVQVAADIIKLKRVVNEEESEVCCRVTIRAVNSRIAFGILTTVERDYDEIVSAEAESATLIRVYDYGSI